MTINNKPIIIILLVLISASLFITYYPDNHQYKETNYVGLLQLGLAPSTYPRELTENDINTHIKVSDGVNEYELISSRTFSTGDFGKTFLRRVD